MGNGHWEKTDVFRLVAMGILLTWVLWNCRWLLGLLGGLLGLFMPFWLGLCIAFIWNIPLRLVEEKWLRTVHFRRPIRKRAAGLGLSFLLSAAILGLLMFLILPELQKTGAVLTEGIPAFLESLGGRLDRAAEGLDNLTLPFDWNARSVMTTMGAALEAAGNRFFAGLPAVAASLSDMLLDLGLGMIFAIYILAQKERLGRQVSRLLYAYVPDGAVVWLLRVGILSSRVFAGFVTGQLTEAGILGGLCLAGMFALRIPYAAAVSALVTLTALVPIFGALLGLALGALLVGMASPIKALWFVIFLVVLQQVETNLIYPRVVGQSIGLPGIWVLLAVTVGGRALGVTGMLLGVPLCSVAYALLRRDVRRRLDLELTEWNENG